MREKRYRKAAPVSIQGYANRKGLTDLPIELICIIFDFLTHGDLGALEISCHGFRNKVREYRTFVKKLVLRQMISAATLKPTLLGQFPRLKILELSHVRFSHGEKIDVELRKLVCLESLRLKGRGIAKKDTEAAKIVDALNQMPRLVELELNHIGMALFSSKKLASVLPRLTLLTQLKIAGLPGEQSSRALIKCLGELPNLTVLHLISSVFHNSSVELADVLPKLENLEDLNISFNSYVGFQITMLYDKVRYLPRLTSLDVSHNFVAGNFPAVALGNALSKLSGLTILDASKIGVQEVGARMIWDGLSYNPGLKELHLAGIMLSLDVIGDPVAERMKQMVNLRFLSLRGGYVTFEGLVVMSPALSQMTNLEYLDLSECEMEDDELSVLAPALSNMENLMFLNLSGNDFGTDGTDELVKAFPNLKKLRHLDMGDCYMGCLATSKLIRGLHHLEDLRCLELSTNAIDDAVCNLIARVLSRMDSLARLGLSWNDISREGAMALHKHLLLKRKKPFTLTI